MKPIATILLWFTCTCLFAQNNRAAGNTSLYKIELITADENRLKALLLEVRDTTVLIYPGKRHAWKTGIHYNAVEFSYTNIQKITLTCGLGRKKYHIHRSKTAFIEFKKSIQ